MDFRDPAVVNVVSELLKVIDDNEKISKRYWFIFSDRKLSPKGSEAATYLFKNREKFNEVIGKKQVDDRLADDYLAEMTIGVFEKGQNIESQRLEIIGEEIKELKLYNEKSMLSVLAIAKAVKAGDVNRLLAKCETELPNLSRGSNKRMLIYYLSGMMQEATEAQKAKWEKIKEANI